MSTTARPPDAAVPGDVVDLATTLGPARAYVRRAPGDVGALVLGHGAGGGVAAADLLAVTEAAHAAGWSVGLVEQPWRVAGRRVATPPASLDEAWRQIVPALLDGALARSGRLVLGGRSAGARVACRTAAALGAAAALCLSFPLHPPGRPGRSRAQELEAGVPVLVVQGNRDPFGSPEEVVAAAPTGVSVVGVAGDHSLARDVPAVVAAVRAWLADLRS